LSTAYRFNVTHLNSYLRCPLCFFFKTILRLPAPKTKSLSFGTAVHGALAYLFETYRRQNELIPLEKFLDIFKSNLKREHLPLSDYHHTLIRGQQILTDYYLHYQSQFSRHCLTEQDFKFFNIHLNNIPITGKIDKIEILTPKNVNVVDFKTGNPDSKYPELKPDGDYFRQLVFYKILCLNAHGFPYQVTKGTIDFIEKSRTGQFKRPSFDITDQHVADLTKLISATYQKIQNLEFAPKSDCPDHDHLHYLSSKYFS
jgi:DNA helicase-2/ATP-dependent DNA helicase PcrA